MTDFTGIVREFKGGGFRDKGSVENPYINIWLPLTRHLIFHMPLSGIFLRASRFRSPQIAEKVIFRFLAKQIKKKPKS